MPSLAIRLSSGLRFYWPALALQGTWEALLGWPAWSDGPKLNLCKYVLAMCASN